MKYTQVFDGDWHRPVMRGWRMLCCSCSLVHIINFRIVGKHVELQARVCKRATAAARRRKKK